MIVEYLSYVVSAAIIITKWFDCTTTQRKIRGIGMEFNPIARALMHRIGIKGTIWFAFVVTLAITVISQYWIQFATTSIYWDYGYILTGSFTALVQGATALNNHQGRPNLVTKQLLRVVSKHG